MKVRRFPPYVPRAIEDRWLAASRQFPVLLLTGPRQVGKTTLLRHLSGRGRAYVTMDDADLRALARREPALFLQRFPPPVLIDEIQYAPELLPRIKMDVDARRRPGAFWLTGSQQFRLMKGVTETLPGRMAVIPLLGFSAREKRREARALPPFLPTPERIAQRAAAAPPTRLATVYQAIWEGSFPALATGQIRDRHLFYRSYIQTYLERDVRDLLQVGDLETFRRFLKAAAARTGQMLNYSDLARDCGVSVNTARHWMSILVASFQVHLLQPWHSNINRRLCKTPKLYFLDTGLCAYLTEWSSPRTLEAGAMSGAIFETHVFTELLKGWWNRIEEPRFYYFRDKDGREIDLLIVRDHRAHPIEIKKSARASPDAVRAFSGLGRIGLKRQAGAVVCLCAQALPIDARTTAIPAGIL